MTRSRRCVSAKILAVALLLHVGSAVAEQSSVLEEYATENPTPLSCDLPRTGSTNTPPSPPASPAHFQSDDPEFVTFRELIRTDAQLSKNAVNGYERDLWLYHKDGGDHSRMRKVAQLTRQLRCSSKCLATVLAFSRSAREAGVEHRKATTMSIRALQDELRARRRAKRKLRTPVRLRDLNTRLQTRLQRWRQEHPAPRARRRLQAAVVK